MERITRSRRGNMLALIGATTFIIVAIILFGLWYASQTMGTTAHRTAIESAALAAATDLGRITIQTPQCGYVSLTGLAPVGTGTMLSDNYYCQVHGINELLASARLDMIIADDMGDANLLAVAKADMTNILAANSALMTALQNACKQGGSGTDAYGNTITPYDDAKNIYLSNQAVQSTYVDKSFQLVMGNISGGMCTATVVPQAANPARFSNVAVAAADQIGNYYRSDTDIVYDGVDFVFGAVGQQAALAGNDKFNAKANLPYAIPCAVQVSASQQFQQQGITQTTNFTACATAGGAFKCPTPGAFTISFPDGPMNEFTKPSDMENAKFKDGKTMAGGIQMSVKESTGGDYPVDMATGAGNAQLVPPVDWSSPANNTDAADIYRVTLYDWLRSGGSAVYVDSAVDMQTTAFLPPLTPTVDWSTLDINGNAYDLGQIPAGILHIYEFNSDGSIQYRTRAAEPNPYLVVSMNEMYAENNQPLQSSTPSWAISITIIAPSKANPNPSLNQIEGTAQYDMYVRDEVHHHGMGKHDGDPCDSTAVAWRQSQPTLAWNGDAGAGGCGAWFQQMSMFPWASSLQTGVSVKGNGLPPMLTDAEDFALTTTAPPPVYVTYEQGPSGGAPRPTYIVNGISSEVRFRRQINIQNLNLLIGGIGYIGLMTNPVASATKGTSIDPVTVNNNDTGTSTSTTTTSATTTSTTTTY